ncbi:hypothetical protein JOM56_001154 [Amanita muscaria]
MSLSNDAESLLEAALPQAFAPAPVRKEVPQPPGSKTGKDQEQEVAQPLATGNPSEEPRSAQEASSGSWKEEYEAQVRRWRVQSAEAREKAETERARWEAVRAAENQDAARNTKESGWESVTEKKGERSLEAETTEQRGESGSQRQADTTTDTSQNWEDVRSSPTSSFPSMSFPARTASPSPSPAPHKDEASRTATLVIFDSSLSTRTRIKAALASLAINLLLPFVNGVMLGFGEVFAKNVVIGWFGWKQLGSAAASKGIGISSWRQRKSN